MVALLSFSLWYLTIALAGWLTFPLTFRMLRGLPDCGYSITRILAWLLWGYLFWILATLGILRNEWSNILACLIILIGLSLWSLKGDNWIEFKGWVSSHRKFILVVEGVFFISFFIWAFIRATNPEALGTEKPMELAFINAILRAPTFPPHDPWLSGYSISYYYFGYILVSMLAKFTGTSGGVAFNLGSALIFALAAVGIYGLVYNVLRSRLKTIEERKAALLAFWGPLFLLFFSNLEGFLHSLHNRGIFWSSNEAGEFVSKFWGWLDIQDLNIPPVQPLQWIPDKFWWWWRASRVIQDYDMAFNSREIIDEFPFFSFLLADLHPHVLAIPFALLCLTVILHILLKTKPTKMIVAGPVHLFFTPTEFILFAIIFGAMGFLNTWDFPIYICLAASVIAFQQISSLGSNSIINKVLDWILNFIIHVLILGIGGVLAYLPFYLSFSSQAGGFIINLIYPTRGAHLWVMFGGMFLLMGLFLVYLFKKEQEIPDRIPSFKSGLLITIAFFAGIGLISLILGILAMLNPELRSFYLGSMSASNPASLLAEAVVRRWIYSLGWLTLFILLAPTLTLLLRALNREPNLPDFLGKPEVFTLFLILFGILLVIMPEFIFLRDQFGWRMNTIFKFYYQAWILWAVASAIGTAVLLVEVRGRWGRIYRVGLGLVILTGLVYPGLSLPAKTNQFNLSEWGLDGGSYLEAQNPDEMAAIRWLQKANFGNIAEAVSPTGGSYTGYARAATLSGLPGVLGWVGHESQWRGGGNAMGNRQADLARLFCSRDPEEILAIIHQYQISYIFLGHLERSTYKLGTDYCPSGLNELILNQILDSTFQAGDVTIYTIPGQLPE